MKRIVSFSVSDGSRCWRRWRYCCLPSASSWRRAPTSRHHPPTQATYSLRAPCPSATIRADDSDNEGGVVLTATNIVPGGPSITGTAKIKNTGTVDGLFTLTGTYIANPPAPIAASDLAFAHTLQCVITENGSQIYAGPLDTIDTIDLKEVAGVQQPWSAGETRTFVFTVIHGPMAHPARRQSPHGQVGDYRCWTGALSASESGLTRTQGRAGPTGLARPFSLTTWTEDR